MIFNLFKTKKYCPVCKMVVTKENATINNGKYYCSEEHAYANKEQSELKQKETQHKNSCCH